MARAAQKPLKRKLVLENVALELFPVTYHDYPLDARDASARLLMDPTFEGSALRSRAVGCAAKLQPKGRANRLLQVPGTGLTNSARKGSGSTRLAPLLNQRTEGRYEPDPGTPSQRIT